jgi:hypothetical protein
MWIIQMTTVGARETTKNNATLTGNGVVSSFEQQHHEETHA